MHAGHIICSDSLRHGHEHFDRLLFDGDSDTDGVEIASPESKEDHPAHYVQWWPARNGIRHTPLCFNFDCLSLPRVLNSLGLLKLMSVYSRSATVIPPNRVTGLYASPLSHSS